MPGGAEKGPQEQITTRQGGNRILRRIEKQDWIGSIYGQTRRPTGSKSLCALSYYSGMAHLTPGQRQIPLLVFLKDISLNLYLQIAMPEEVLPKLASIKKVRCKC